MRRNLVLLIFLALAALLVFGCSNAGKDYQTGYAAYGQQAYQGGAPQGVVGGGCSVAGPEPTTVGISNPSPAA